MEHQSGAALYQEHLNTAMEHLRSDWSAEDLRAALRPDVLANAQLLERSLRNGEGDIRGWLVLGWVYFYRLRAQGSPASRDDWIAAATAFAPCFIAEVEPLPEILLPTIVDFAANRAVALLREVDLSTVREVVRLWRRIVAATAPDDSQRARRLSQLSVALQQQFDLFGVPSDREAAFAFAEDALRSTPADQSPPAEILYNVGSLLWSRYGLSLEPGDLDQALDYMQRAVSAGLPDLPHTGEALITLAVAHLARYRLGTDPADLDRSIAALERAVEACPAAGAGRRDALGLLSHSQLVRFKTAGVRADLTASMVTVRQAVDEAVRSRTLTPALPSKLGEALLVAFGCYGNPKDLDEAIDRYRQSVRLADPEDPARAVYLAGLGVAHRTRFDQFGNPEDLDQAIVHGRSAVEAAAADTDLLRGSLGSLGHALQSRFEADGAQQDIDDAVDILGRALTITPIGLADRPDALSNYGGALHARFRLNAGPADLEGAIEVLQEAVEVAPARHVDRATYLSNLCIALSSRFRSAGAITDLEAAVAFGEQAVEVTPKGHPGRPGYLSNVALALGDRFRRSGALADLDAAISYGAEAVAATSQDNPDRAMYLSNLGGTLQTRFWRTGAESDLDAAIEANAEALRLTPPDRPDQGLLLSSYAMSLAARYERTGDARDVDHAVKLLRRAVDITPAGHPERGGFISNLGAALRSRFTVTRSRRDLEAAVETGRQAVAACREEQPHLTAALANLGVSREAMFVETGRGREEAVGAFEAASKFTSGAPSTRIRAARSAAALLAGSDPARGAELLADAVELLPTVAERWLRRNDKQRELGGVSGLAGDAAALMLSGPGSEPLARATVERALIVLESGRTVLLGQALESRTDLMDLRAVHPHLAERFTGLTDLLDSDLSAPVREAVQAPARTGAIQTAQQLGRHRAALDLAELIDRIRSLHGFTDFLRQPTAEDLIGEARPGPVVVFNVSRYGSDALAVREDGVSRIQLGELDVKSLATRIRAFDAALSTAGDPRAARAARIQAQRDVSAVLEWLWDVVAEPVLSALGLDVPPSPDAPMPRVWWIPGGVLGLLPLHAAGYHRDAPVGQGGRTVLDRVISSYAPSIRSLRHARRTAGGVPPADRRSLIVAMPVTPDLPNGAPLHQAVSEAARVGDLLPSPQTFIATEPSDGPAGAGFLTKEKILVALEQSAFVHFACHGITDRTDPAQSRLLLSDHRSDPLTVASLARISLGAADLAYLSACSTAASVNTVLADEAIHLTSAFQLAGFRHVIGTLWEIDDTVAAIAAEHFYDVLGEGPYGLDTTRSAEALHRTVRVLREKYRATPSLWAAYVHTGA
ncbi:CHAT domain-containing tetratricopeptide repeat protein [Streptomyces lavendulae]|uniref:CHAT domain-containing tetratricopeptide repeat protein n=1 Tax=Streptomyces lavendulae TaxID=1914 RepID=UPI0024A29742|nr:CHAT domain-containing protein [Streptomyces lavendulae]GLV99149.1 CHAT domain-containing protein [Streptomyces lavendulae subsp. lavendulae]